MSNPTDLAVSPSDNDDPKDDFVKLEEFLADPLIHLIMKADGVDRHELAEIIGTIGKKFREGSGSETDTKPAMLEAYRPGVGIMLLNRHGEVLIGRRIDTAVEAWQMPQGGIREDEPAQTAALRELREEIGTDNVEILAESKGWLQYDLPSELNGKAWNGKWRGQRQKWFVMRYLGDDADINVQTEQPEFSNWQWITPEALPSLIVEFKRELYTAVLNEFTPPIESGAKDADMKIGNGVNCVFCAISPESVIAENTHAFLIYDIQPASPLHMLALPRRHVASCFELTPTEHSAIEKLLLHGRNTVLRKDRAVEGFNIGANDGQVAGQTVFHCHYHLIPRRPGDVADPRGGVRAVIAKTGTEA